MIDIDGTALCCPVYKIPWLSKARRLKTWILALLPDWDHLFFKQRHHTYGVFFRGQTEKAPAYMGCHTEIHFIYMFGLAMLYDGKVNESFCHIVSDQLRPYFLLAGMEIAQADGIFELAERSFYDPSGRIEKLYTFRWKFIRRQVCHNTFIGRPAEKGEGRAVRGKEAQAWPCVGLEGCVETVEDGFQCFRPELGALLVKGRGRRGVCLQAKEIKQFYPGAGRASGNQEGDEPVSPHFSGTGEVPAGTGCIL